MSRYCLRISLIVLCLAGLSSGDNLAAQDAASDPKAIEGLWAGPWGHCVSPEGVVHQPVMAELLIKGSRVEMDSFPDFGQLWGTIRIDTAKKLVRVSPKVEPGSPPAKEIQFSYEIKKDKLTLTDSNKRSIDFSRHGAARVPMAGTAVQIVVATGINNAGDLLVSEVSVLRAGRAGETFFDTAERKLKTRLATIFLEKETGLSKITVDEARRLIRQATPVVIAYRQDERTGEGSAPGNDLYRLWTGIGPVAADSEAAVTTFSRTLRPGTLFFVLSSRANVPEP
jgi:hypothetical protein